SGAWFARSGDVVRPDDAALLLQNGKPLRRRTVELQPNPGAAAILAFGDEDSSGRFESFLQTGYGGRVGLCRLPLEILDGRRLRTGKSGECGPRYFDKGAR